MSVFQGIDSQMLLGLIIDRISCTHDLQWTFPKGEPASQAFPALY